MNLDSTIGVRREAVVTLGAAMRRLMLATLETEVSNEELLQVAAVAVQESEILERVRRKPGQMSSTDDLATGVRLHGPVAGLGNPQALPLQFERDGTTAVVRATFDRRFEGPPGHVHGGQIALMLDEVFARAMIYAGKWGLTGKFDLTYRQAIPLETPVVMIAEIKEINGRKTTVNGGIYSSIKKTDVYVEGTALFIEPSKAREEQYFNAIVDAGGQRTSHRLGSSE